MDLSWISRWILYHKCNKGVVEVALNTFCAFFLLVSKGILAGAFLFFADLFFWEF